MHQYLRAIGLDGSLSKTQIYDILSQVEKHFTHHQLVSQKENMDYCQFDKEYGDSIGITVFGDMDLDEHFQREYYFPYFRGTGITSYADVTIEKRIDKESYMGICEDVKVGINLIFHLQNSIEYMKEAQIAGHSVKYKSITLSGLCNKGMILFPVMKDPVQEKQQKADMHNRMMLMSAARTGDSEAIESLTLEDMDTYSEVSRRIVDEDVFSIVDTYIMPYGVECDRYSILGNMLDVRETNNEVTDEKIYIMRLDVNELIFDICVPASKLTGEPEIGRRFKGNIWLQGWINF